MNRYCNRPFGRTKKEFKDEFLSKVDKKGHNGCWELKSGKINGSHRISWKIYNNREIPKGLFICHTCDNPACVRPGHLYLGTPQENNRDAKVRGRHKIRSSSRIDPRGRDNKLILSWINKNNKTKISVTDLNKRYV